METNSVTLPSARSSVTVAPTFMLFLTCMPIQSEMLYTCSMHVYKRCKHNLHKCNTEAYFTEYNHSCLRIIPKLCLQVCGAGLFTVKVACHKIHAISAQSITIILNLSSYSPPATTENDTV